MALISCGECNAEISDKADACPKCGFPVPKPLPPVNLAETRPQPPPQDASESLGLGVKIVIAVISLFAVILILNNMSRSPEAQARGEAKDKIARCWEEQGRKSLSGGVQRGMAGICEMWEQEFQQKYGYKP